MNRTDRLYALVEELRASAPCRRTARELAERFEVSVRTIERDIGALQQAGVPIYADTGRRGGYTLDRAMTLPPLNFSPAEAVAVAITLSRAGGAPFERSARTALQKMVAAMSASDGAQARELAKRIHFVAHPDDRGGDRHSDDAVPSVPAVIEDAVATRRVLRLRYVDGNGAETERDVEAVAFVSGVHGWYLVAWCRLRSAARVFRVDRVRRATLLDEVAPPRDIAVGAPPDLVARSLEFV